MLGGGDILASKLGDLADPFKGIFGGIPDYLGADFKDGFIITELPADGVGTKLSFVGEWLPHQPFSWGGEQHLAKEYYPGNPEPTVQVLGGRETDLKIKGRFKVKRLSTNANEPDVLRLAAQAMCEEVDAMRKRGNLVKLTLGEWQRWGFIEKTNFNMKTLADSEYEIDFFIIGDAPPSGCKLADEGFDAASDLNTALITEAMNLEKSVTNLTGVNLGLFAQLNALVGEVAAALAVVTKFVDATLSIAEDAEKFANRAVGLVKYAMATVSSFKRRVGQLNAYIGSDPLNPGIKTWSEPTNARQAALVAKLQTITTKPIELSPAQQAATSAKPDKYTPDVSTQQKAAAKAGGQSIDAVLLAMLKKFSALAQSLPKARHLVKAGDTLQTISVRYYGTPDDWQKVYKHNNLTTTVLVPGAILEIPK